MCKRWETPASPALHRASQKLTLRVAQQKIEYELHADPNATAVQAWVYLSSNTVTDIMEGALSNITAELGASASYDVAGMQP